MSRAGSRAVFLDRDGVINCPIVKSGKPFPPQTLQEFVYIDGISETLHALRALGFHLYVVTNQPDVARGTMAKATVESFHAKILTDLPIDKIYTCYHDDAYICECRKPKPGLLYQAREDFAIELGNSFMIGDRWRDIDCGNQAGCKTVFIDYGYDEGLKTKPTHTVKDVRDLLKYIEKVTL